jgi:DNA polymerase III subunit epsilon
MKPNLKFTLVALASLLSLLGVCAVIAAAVWTDFQPEEQEAVAAALHGRLPLVLVLLAVAAGAVVAAMRAAFSHYALAPLRIAEEARLILGANPERRVSHVGAAETMALVQVFNELADQRDELKRDVEAKVREGRASVEEERNRLGALMSELTQSVVVCNLDGRIILYNNRARLQFKALADGAAAAGGTLIGLGRSIFAIFERNLIAHALENIQNRLKRAGSQPMANFVTTSRAGQLIRVQMAPVLSTSGEPGQEQGGERQVTGYVLMLDNITRSFEAESRRDQALQSLTEGSRGSLGNIRAAVETLADYPDMEAAQRESFINIVRDEVRAMSQRLNDTASQFADALKTRWPLEEMLGMDLIQAVQRRIEDRIKLRTRIDGVDESLWLRVDSFSLLQGVSYLAYRLNEDYDVREIRFRLAAEGRFAHLDLVWVGALVGSETLVEWEMEPMNLGGEASPLTLRDVVDRHDGEIWTQRETATQRHYFRLLVPLAAPQVIAEPETVLRAESRPEYYDFDLFKMSEGSHELDDRLLTELTYTVFDTETTGLDPSAGDEIIQFGALRIVNNRLLRAESFEQLVDPGRSLAPESIQVHGITPDMLVGQPAIERVMPTFHAFCEDTVLVAHNAAFDMRFLQMKEAMVGVHFGQPVLDTLLLSAVIHPNQETHRLEAIAERFGIKVIGRHTALGDAFVTGEVFLKMIPLLAEKGIRTLRQAREAAQQTYYARVKY